MANTSEVLEEAMSLSRIERSYLAGKLLESLDRDDSPVDAEWRQEINRRVEEIDAGTAVLVPHEQVMNSARQSVRNARQSKA